ncbi:sugar-binding protein [Kineococcus glutinatus]|uniref:Sugar ABC transporter substrate-binding protein n=1 Tax=Kineococcus glutinatus TaxID=1070872 RepID=A0ABP9H9S5_9ACTN
MRTSATAAVGFGLAAVLTLSSCATGRGSSGSGSEDGGGALAAGSLVGVSLPNKTSENWVIAGELLTDDLTAAGFEPSVQYASSSGTVADQQAQIQTMIDKGVEALIIGAADGGQLATQVEAAHDAGIPVIAFDRLIENTEAVDYYATADNLKVGTLMGQALIDGMRKRDPSGAPYTIEIFSGSPDDSNSALYYDGYMNVLKPLIDSGEVVVGSGQVTFEQTATEGWKPENAGRRMDGLLNSTYSDGTELDGVLGPADILSRAIITSIQGAGQDVPVVTGHDAESESVKWIMQRLQDSTVYSNPGAMVDSAVSIVVALSKEQNPRANDTTTFDNGAKIVPALVNPPLTVTRDNAAEVLGDNPLLAPLVTP